jgi:hypothetical protein
VTDLLPKGHLELHRCATVRALSYRRGSVEASTLMRFTRGDQAACFDVTIGTAHAAAIAL